MRTSEQDEERAVERLIAQIDSIDAWRDRVGRRIVCLFLLTFAFAVGLLFWTVKQVHGNPPGTQTPPGPQVPAVLRRML
ncbi:MAG: hypothetical protein IH602_09950 [Bryobacteraceae bacterium]|jgi:hypothetical protein|nr:hypothetical protein [Bryobacteraceae bacterium]